MKHNKKRNTAFIYESLSRELTKAIVDNDLDTKQKVVTLIKEHFGKGSVLFEELSLYKALVDTTNIQEKVAERMLQETKIAHSQLDSKSVFDAQSKVIAAINKGLSTNVWANFVPNFKSLASVSAIFNSKTPVKKRVLFEQAVVQKMSVRTEAPKTEDLKPLDNLAYHSFITKFNEKYGDLLQEQKDLLNRYITSFADDGFELRVYLNEELSRLKTLVADATQNIEEPVLVTKLKGIQEYLEGFRKREFTGDDLNKVLKTQQLVQELLVND
tara:strand:- start:64 stop:876 length:813 start_codon:yes stop_codon:yes gene_type:complete